MSPLGCLFIAYPRSYQPYREARVAVLAKHKNAQLGLRSLEAYQQGQLPELVLDP